MRKLSEAVKRFAIKSCWQKIYNFPLIAEPNLFVSTSPALQLPLILTSVDNLRVSFARRFHAQKPSGKERPTKESSKKLDCVYVPNCERKKAQ